MTPGWLGGVEWGGASFDPMTNMLFVNANDAPSIGSIRQVYQTDASRGGTATPVELGRQIYERSCMACHGASREGAPPTVPSLVNVLNRVKPEEIQALLRTGRNTMPAFNQFRPKDVTNVIDFLKTVPLKNATATFNSAGTQLRFASAGTRQFLDPIATPRSPRLGAH